jgi:hypothetical protein
LENQDNVIVQLDQLENREHQPYYDSMKAIDVVNKLIGRNANVLASYNAGLKRDYVTLQLDGFRAGSIRPGGHNWDYDDDNPVMPLSIGDNKKHSIVRNAEGKELQSFRNVTIVQRPFKGLMPKNRVVSLVPGNIPVTSSYVADMIRRYNCIRTVIRIDEKLAYRLADKKDTVFSRFHNGYILKEDGIFTKAVNGIVHKNIYKHSKFREDIKLLRIKRLFVNKLVSVRPDGIKHLKEQLALLPGKISLSSIRPSRTFMLKTDNITATSVILNGIPVPIQYIKIIKKQNHGQN